MNFDPLIVLTARYFLALLLLAAGLHKSADLDKVRGAIAAYRAVPSGLEKPAVWLVIGVEVAVGAALIVPSTSRSASLVAAGVFAVYFTVMSLNWLRGDRDVDCGCSFYHGDASLSGAHLVRNVLLVMLGVAGFQSDAGRAISWVDGVQIAAAVASLALIYLSADALLAHRGSTARREA
jgi:uncharacterized membrane protein YphA (DoxX/SURF4 family)